MIVSGAIGPQYAGNPNVDFPIGTLITTTVGNIWVKTGAGASSWTQQGTPTTISGSATYDPASIAPGVRVTTTLTVTGAVLGDTVAASFSLDTLGVKLYAWVSLANTATVEFSNPTGATIDLASGTLKVKVL